MVTTDPETTTLEQLRSHLSRFNLTWMLRCLGQLSALVEGKTGTSIEGVAVAAYCLPYLALVAIEVSSDDVVTIPSHADLAEAARIFNGMTEPRINGGSDPWIFEYLIRMGCLQFAGTQDLHNATARTWMLYHELWPKVPKAAGFHPAKALHDLTGLSLRQLVALGYAYSVLARPGYFVPYPEDALKKLPTTLGVRPEEQQRFLDWMTGTYDEIRKLGAREVPHAAYDKYRLSPFLVKPVVRPDRPPEAGAEAVLLVPSPRYLARRVTDGVYHTLATASAAHGVVNPFREAFGHVFQEYVGELLRAGSGKAKVLREREYGRKHEQRRTPDWLVLDGERLVVIEVKQSALTLDSKTLGAIDDVVRDLRKTLAAGTRQLLKFRDDLQAKAAGLEDLHGVTDVELLVVTHDQVPFANWLLRDLIAGDGIKDATDVHLCSIDDFENLQRYCWGTSLHGHLRSKRSDFRQSHAKDFREWLSEIGSPGQGHLLLKSVFADLALSWGTSSSVQTGARAGATA